VSDELDDLIARDLDVFWHPASQMRSYRTFPPLVVKGASGCRIELADGSVVLDGISSWWCKSLGHGHPRIKAALAAQLERFEHVITAGTTNEPLVRLCERLLAMANGLPVTAWGPQAPRGRAPGRFGKVFLADNGSTAVEIALKMAIQAQAQRGERQRTRFAAFANGYHGETIATLAVGDLGRYAAPFAALTFEVTKLGHLPYRTGPADPDWLAADAAWAKMEAELAPLAGQLAAIIYEPVLQAAGGMRLYSPALLPRLCAWAQAHGVLLIGDEIAAGFGRLGTMLASHSVAGALPDFVVLSKGLTGGFLPLSAVVTTDAVYASFEDETPERAFLHSNTYTGNALGVAAALAALDAYADEDVLAGVAARAPVLRAEMEALAATRHLPVRAAGLVAAIDLAADPARKAGQEVARRAVRRGLLVRPLGDTLYLFPPLNTPPADLRAMVAVLGDSVDDFARNQNFA
jgi:adenosylmethionine-8-amino-7-oxononanoate aminotransferase